MKHLFFSLAMGAYLLLIGSDCDKSNVDPIHKILDGSFIFSYDQDFEVGIHKITRSTGTVETTDAVFTEEERNPNGMEPSVFFSNIFNNSKVSKSSFPTSENNYLIEYYDDGTTHTISSTIPYHSIIKTEITRNGKHFTWDTDGKRSETSYYARTPSNIGNTILKGYRTFLADMETKYPEAYYRENYPKTYDILGFPPSSKSVAITLEAVINEGGTIKKVKEDGNRVIIEISTNKFSSIPLIGSNIAAQLLTNAGYSSLIRYLPEGKIEMDYNTKNGILYGMKIIDAKTPFFSSALIEYSKELERENPYSGLSTDEILKLRLPTRIRYQKYEFTLVFPLFIPDYHAKKYVGVHDYTYVKVKNNLLKIGSSRRLNNRIPATYTEN